jgi:hypothetical protein
MTGTIWFVQIVHYPLLPNIGMWSFVPYKYASLKATIFLIAVPMLVELVTGIALLAYSYHEAFVKKYLKINALLLFVIWLFSCVIDIALNLTLIYKGQHPTTQTILIVTSWVRTIAWTVRAIILFAIALTLFDHRDKKE